MIRRDEVNSVYVTSIRFQIENSGDKGRCIMEAQVNYADGRIESIKAVARVISIWVNENNNEAVRAFLKINKNNIPLKKLLEFIKLFGMIKCPDGVVSSNNRTIIRYGQRPEIPYTSETDNYNTETYYESKEALITEVLKVISRVKQVSGLDLVTFRGIRDDLLYQFGFERVTDRMFSAPDMWRGQTDKILDVSDSYYANYKEQKGNAEAFLKLLESELGEKKDD